MLNRSHRLEVRDQSEAMFRVQNQTIAMSERTLALIEKIQEGMGRVAELEKSVAQRAATPPPPVDYTPVLHGVVAAIRDIGVSALQRDYKPKPKTEEEAAPVKAALTDKTAAPAQVNGTEQAMPAAIGASPNAPALPAAPTPISPPVEQQSMAELLARLARLEAERERMASELAAERKRQEILSELSGGVPAPKTSMRSESSVQAGPTQPEKTASTAGGRGASQESVPPEEEPHAQKYTRRGEQQQTVEASADREREEAGSADQPTRPTQRPLRQQTEPREPRESEPPNERAALKKSGMTEEPKRPSGSVEPTSLAIEPVILPPRAADSASPFTPKTSRNSSCPCGSGRKYKKCCLPKEQQAAFRDAAAARQRAPRETVPTEPATQGQIAAPPGPTLPVRAASTLSERGGSGAGLETRTAAQIAATDTKAKSAEPIKAASPPEASKTGSMAPPRQEAAGTRTSPTAESGTSAHKKTEMPSAPPEVLPGVLGEQLQELLVNTIAGRMLANPEAPIPPPQVPRVDLVEQVIVTPSKMDPETAVKLLKDGTALETLGAFLFFNPAVRDLLSRRGK